MSTHHLLLISALEIKVIKPKPKGVMQSVAMAKTVTSNATAKRSLLDAGRLHKYNGISAYVDK